MQEQENQQVGKSYPSIVAHDSAYVHAGDVNIYHGDAKEQMCHRVFKTSTYEEFKDRNPPRVEGTCQWVLNSSQFQRWRQSPHNDLLWISADPGCGKSVLAKSLVDQDLRHGRTSTICYFFFKDNKEQDSLATALCALLHQLYTQQPHLIQYALAAYKENGEKLQRETREMWRILQHSVCDSSALPTICVLDALDECRENDRKQLITLLCSFFTQSIRGTSDHNLKFLVTSRPYDNVQRWFDQAVSHWPHVRLRGEDENEHIREEINLVVNQQVRTLADEVALSSSSRDHLLNQLLSMQHRTYLWLHLAMDEIRETYLNSLFPEEVAIESLPSSVNQAYERILNKISEKQRPMARKILLIIVGARRPLKVGEMAIALAVARLQQSDAVSLVIPNPTQLEKQIRHLCGLFVFIQHSTLFLIHQTAKEFLLADNSVESIDPGLWQASLTLDEIDNDMVQICTKYLRTFMHKTAPRHIYQRIERSTESKIKGVPATDNSENEFFEYCAVYWTKHFQDGRVSEDVLLLDRVLELFDVETGLFHSWFSFFWHAWCRNYRGAPEMLRQHAIAWAGHRSILEHLCKKQDINLEARDSEYNRVLAIAANRGHVDLLSWLILAEVDVDARCGRYHSYTALTMAMLVGRERIVQMLIEAGADTNIEQARSHYHSSALAATPFESLEMVSQALSNIGASVHERTLRISGPLIGAVRAGMEETVQKLIATGADVNATAENAFIPLVEATHCGHEKIVQMLIDAGADVEARDFFYGSALLQASKIGNEKMVQMLIDAGADVNARVEAGGHLESALDVATRYRHEGVRQKLIAAGATV